MKKHTWIKISMIIAAGFILCYLVGQFVVLPLRQKAPEGGTAVSGEYSEHFSFVEGFAGFVRTENRESVKDNPWGYNMGVFSLEDIGEGILIMPGTAMNPDFSDFQGRVLTLEYAIHP